MKSNTFVTGLVALSLLIGGPAFAEKDGVTNDEGRPVDPLVNNKKARPPNRAPNHDRSNEARQYDGRANPGRGHTSDQRYLHDERGAGPNRQFHRGDRLAMEYRQRYYVVNDWRLHNLPPPPHGHHWIQTGADYVLVAIATGIILGILLNH